MWETGFDEEEGVDRKLLGMKRTISDETRLYEFGFMADALDNNIFIVIDAESDCELYGGQVMRPNRSILPLEYVHIIGRKVCARSFNRSIPHFLNRVF